MQLHVDNKPMARGVTHLMYVGDDDAVDNALAVPKPSPRELAVGAIAAVVALQSRGITRLAAAGIAAWVGYRAYKAR
jgi:hypothetical protein